MACGCGPGGCGAHKRGASFDPELEGPSEADLAKFGGDEIECPECGETVYYDVPVCPRCGHAMMRGEGGRKGLGAKRGAILAIGAALALLGFIVVAMRNGFHL